MLALKQ